MLLAFGELEYLVCKIAAENSSDSSPVLRALYRINGTTPRYQAADALVREIHLGRDMGDVFGEAIGAFKTCVTIRHQYAHCSWADGGKGRNGGLYFTDPTVTAEAAKGWDQKWRHVNIGLLKAQSAYFEYVRALLLHIESMSTAWQRSELLPFPRPTRLELPRMHNPPDKHIPQWLSAADKQRHLEDALAAKKTVRSQERARRDGKPHKPKQLSARQTREKRIRAALRKRRAP